MEPSPTRTADKGSRRQPPGRPSFRGPLGARKRFERQAARLRIAAHVQRRPTLEQQTFDPLLRGASSLQRRRFALTAAVVGSLAVHVVVIGIGMGLRQPGGAAKHDEVKIEIKPPPPAPPPEKKPEPPPPVEEPKKAPPKIVKAAPPPPQAVEPPKAVRVVGLSLESTTEGGDGPSFAVGNTRLGETAERAVAPKDVTAMPASGPVAPVGPPGSGKSNRAASRIPVAGVKYTQPQQKDKRKPLYPPTLKSQGIEADIWVVVSIDTNGKVTSAKVLKPSPYPEFDEAALTAAKVQEWEPATRDGVPMPYQTSFQYRFRLEDE